MKLLYRNVNSDVDIVLNKKGDWIDLSVPEQISIKAGENTIVNSGVCIRIPDGYEAIIALRSSSFKQYKTINPTSIGIIDGCYIGDDDEWKFSFLAFEDVIIPKGSRVFQFRIQLSQFATPWQKIKWLFSSKIEMVKVKGSFSKKNRGGFGSTGK